ncbi:MAG: hypothetical protein Q8Q12_18785 [bacterium]|nr:hypothetical protein [bacterium]
MTTINALRFLLICLLLATIGAVQSAQGPDGTWPFSPGEDAFSEDAILDLRPLNEKQSGETGFVRLSKDGNDFVKGNGEPIRFWAIGSEIYKRTPEEMDRHCRFLAKVGVNMARLHTTVADTTEGAAISDVNEKVIDGIFRFIKAAKQNGIYVTISPYYGHHKTLQSWGLEGYGPDEMPWGAIFTDPKMQEGYRAWTKELYTRNNPYTDHPIKDDPTVAILQIHNEDSLFFWTMQRLPEPQARRLGKSFGDWLIKRYGSLEKAKAAWDGHAENGDDFANGVVALMSTWHMTQEWKGGQAKRLRDQVQFYGEYQRDFYARMGQYIREELGCKQLLNATNWRTANDLKLKEIERWTYAALDMDAENEYYGSDYQHIGENNGYRIDPDHYIVNESCLHKPLELTTNYKCQVGHPFIVTETSWKNPNLYQTEGPFLVAAYQSLNGVDIVYWFTATEPTWCLDPRSTWWWVRGMNPLNKWTCSIPALAGMFPANAIIFRNRYVKQGDIVVHEVRSLDSLWERQPPLIDDNEIYGVSRETEECGKMWRADGRLSRAAFLVGRVEAVLGGNPAETRAVDFSRFLEPNKQLIRSSTGQLLWNYGVGLCLMDAPKAQGVTGFLKAAGGRFQLNNTLIESQNEYATVSVVSMDDQSLTRSRRILVQVGTTARLTGWEDKDAEFKFEEQTIRGKQIVNTGKPPWQIENTRVRITIANPSLSKATRLDVSGYVADEVPLLRTSGGITAELPVNAMYFVLE